MFKLLRTYLGILLILALFSHAGIPHQHHYLEVVTLQHFQSEDIEHCASFNDVVIQKLIQPSEPQFIAIMTVPENLHFEPYRQVYFIFIRPIFIHLQIPVHSVSPTRGSPTA